MIFCGCQHRRLAAVLLLIAACHAAAEYLPSPLLGQQQGLKFMEAETYGNASGHKSLLLPLGWKPGAIKSRKLLRAAALGVEGSVKALGYFYVNAQLGSPPHPFQLIIDTGSTITYVPCADCKQCGKHKDAPFNPKTSTTSHMLGCGSPKCNCGTPSCQCVNNQCYYSRSYAEQSSSDGILLEDVFGFPDITGSAEAAVAGTGRPKPDDVYLVFGCEYRETGEIYRQIADGIMGLGNNNNALQSQLVEQKVIEDTFYLCFGHPTGGLLMLGEVPLSRQHEFTYTPMKPHWQSHYYTLTMDHMSVGGKKVPVPASTYASGYGSVLDSGTTFTYLPSDAFRGFVALLSEAMQAKGLSKRKGNDPQYNDVCWQDGPEDPAQLSSVFPDAEMVFKGGATLKLAPLQYLFVSGVKGVYCLGVFDNGGQGTLIGGITVRNVLVQYDRRSWRAGFLPVSSCDEVRSLIQPVTNKPTEQHDAPGSGVGNQAGSSGSGAGSGGSGGGSSGSGSAGKTSEKSDGSTSSTGSGVQPVGGHGDGSKALVQPHSSVEQEELDKNTVSDSSSNRQPIQVPQQQPQQQEAGREATQAGHVIPLGHPDETVAEYLGTAEIHRLTGRQQSNSWLFSPAIMVAAGVVLGMLATMAWANRAHIARRLQSITAASDSSQQGQQLDELTYLVPKILEPREARQPGDGSLDGGEGGVGGAGKWKSQPPALTSSV